MNQIKAINKKIRKLEKKYDALPKKATLTKLRTAKKAEKLINKLEEITKK